MPKHVQARAMLVLAAMLNIIPLAYTGLLLAPGTVTGGDTDARLHFIAGHAEAWSVGWFLWMGGSIGLVLSIWVLSQTFLLRTRTPALLRFAPLVAVIGGTVDLVGDAIQATTFPTLASHYVALAPGDPARATIALIFDVMDHLASGVSAGVANTVYCIAGVLVLASLATISDFPRWLTALGALAWLATLAATPAVFFPHLLPFVVAGALGMFAAWLVAIAVWGIGDFKLRVPHLYHYRRV